MTNIEKWLSQSAGKHITELGITKEEAELIVRSGLCCFDDRGYLVIEKERIPNRAVSEVAIDSEQEIFGELKLPGIVEHVKVVMGKDYLAKI